MSQLSTPHTTYPCIFDKTQQVGCFNCRHFYQHYVCINGKYSCANAGHCVMPRIKLKKPADSCERWEAVERPPSRE